MAVSYKTRFSVIKEDIVFHIKQYLAKVNHDKPEDYLLLSITTNYKATYKYDNGDYNNTMHGIGKVRLYFEVNEDLGSSEIGVDFGPEDSDCVLITLKDYLELTDVPDSIKYRTLKVILDAVSDETKLDGDYLQAYLTDTVDAIYKHFFDDDE